MAHLVPILSKILLIYDYYADVVCCCAAVMDVKNVHNSAENLHLTRHTSKQVEKKQTTYVRKKLSH